MKTARQHLREAENHLSIAYSRLERALHRASQLTHDPAWINRFHEALNDNLKSRQRLHALGTDFGLATEPPI